MFNFSCVSCENGEVVQNLPEKESQSWLLSTRKAEFTFQVGNRLFPLLIGQLSSYCSRSMVSDSS